MPRKERHAESSKSRSSAKRRFAAQPYVYKFQIDILAAGVYHLRRRGRN